MATKPTKAAAATATTQEVQQDATLETAKQLETPGENQDSGSAGDEVSSETAPEGSATPQSDAENSTKDDVQDPSTPSEADVLAHQQSVATALIAGSELPPPPDGAPADEVDVVVRSHFTLTDDLHRPFVYSPQTTRMPREHAEHWYALAHGVTKKQA